MTRIQHNLTIAAPGEAIIACVSNPRRLPEWNQLIARVWDVQETPAVVGTTWKLAAKVAGGEQEVTARINRYEPPQHLGLELVDGVAGMRGLTASMELEARPTAAKPGGSPSNSSYTQVICTLDIHLPWLVGGAALGRVISPLISSQLRQGLLHLKRALEAAQEERATGG